VVVLGEFPAVMRFRSPAAPWLELLRAKVTGRFPTQARQPLRTPSIERWPMPRP
jgi:hypothetical protein